VAGEAIPLAASAYFRSVLTTTEHILIPKRLLARGEISTEAYSHYGTLHGMALPLVLYPMSPLTSFSGLLVPEFAEDKAGGNVKRMERVARRALNTTMTYSVLSAVLLYYFAEELGYAVYGSLDAGRFISVLALIVPIMYMDHVTDGMLKGIGEQVYSMWVNISDSLISVVLVYILIPPLGILGYAVVIVVMEGYNFLLSILRLRRRIRLKVDIFGSAILPASAALLSAYLTDKLFTLNSSLATAKTLVPKMIFTLACFVLIMSLSKIFYKRRSLTKINNKTISKKIDNGR
jgi:stage V sporulation protein B